MKSARTEQEHEAIRVLIVDDQPVVLAGLRGMISSLAGVEVIGESRDGTDALQKAEQLNPDVILMDVRMPGVTGLEVLRRVKQASPQIEVVLITESESDLDLVEGLRAGARGYLTKESSRKVVHHALECARHGVTVISTQLLNQAFGTLVSSADARDSKTQLSSLVDLTPRERQVLKLVADGMTNRAICKRLSLTEIAVKEHVQSLVLKIGARDRTQLAVRALRLGIID
ncbi:MAG: response regulator transcription factor [Armatimonadetes bacterium]|nr:response regulator transcription factor [Armatimonadota bacterium]